MRPRWWLLISITIAALSFSGLLYVLTSLWPDPDSLLAAPQLLLFFFTFFGVSAATIPLAFYLNRRFSKPDWFQRDQVRLLREAFWGGLFIVLLIYLQLLRALNWPIVIVLAGVLILMEAFFLTRE